MNALGASANLYNGSAYTAYYPSTSGTPFWNADFHTGTIGYEGVVYNDIPIAYDLVSDEVLIKDARQVIIKLDAAKINFFSIAGHTFVRLKEDTASANTLPADVYDLIYNGSVKVYVKRKKQVARNIGPDGRYPFMTYDAYFVHKDNKYYPVSKKNDLLKLFKDKDDAIREFWKAQKLNYRDDPELTIIRTASYYDQAKRMTP